MLTAIVIDPDGEKFYPQTALIPTRGGWEKLTFESLNEPPLPISKAIPRRTPKHHDTGKYVISSFMLRVEDRSWDLGPKVANTTGLIFIPHSDTGSWFDVWGVLETGKFASPCHHVNLYSGIEHQGSRWAQGSWQNHPGLLLQVFHYVLYCELSWPPVICAALHYFSISLDVLYFYSWNKPIAFTIASSYTIHKFMSLMQCESHVTQTVITYVFRPLKTLLGYFQLLAYCDVSRAYCKQILPLWTHDLGLTGTFYELLGCGWGCVGKEWKLLFCLVLTTLANGQDKTPKSIHLPYTLLIPAPLRWDRLSLNPSEQSRWRCS